MNKSTTTDLAIKLEKMARLAFDPAAAEGESFNAATMIVQIVRKNQIGFDGFKKLLGIDSNTSRLDTTFSLGLMPFGKYCGRTIAEVYEINPDYLDWVLSNVKSNKKLKAQITELLRSKRN